MEACPDPDGPHERALILLVDDEPLVRRCIRLTLESGGYDVLEAGGSHGALQFLAARGKAVSLVLTDYAMPGMDGWGLLRAIRVMLPELPVILMTGWAPTFSHDVSTAQTSVLEKPFTAAVLLENVGRLLRRA